MDPNRLLTAADACRFERAFRKLEPHRLSGWSLTGGIAIELHILRCAKSPSIALSTISTSSLPSLPASPGKNMLQCVDPETAVRLDVFRAYGEEM